MSRKRIAREQEFAGYRFTTGPDGTTIHRKAIDTGAPGDHGADPIGDGTYRMVPSGGIVSAGERDRRLAQRRTK